MSKEFVDEIMYVHTLYMHQMICFDMNVIKNMNQPEKGNYIFIFTAN